MSMKRISVAQARRRQHAHVVRVVRGGEVEGGLARLCDRDGRGADAHDVRIIAARRREQPAATHDLVVVDEHRGAHVGDAEPRRHELLQELDGVAADRHAVVQQLGHGRGWLCDYLDPIGHTHEASLLVVDAARAGNRAVGRKQNRGPQVPWCHVFPRTFKKPRGWCRAIASSETRRAVRASLAVASTVRSSARARRAGSRSGPRRETRCGAPRAAGRAARSRGRPRRGWQAPAHTGRSSGSSCSAATAAAPAGTAVRPARLLLASAARGWRAPSSSRSVRRK